MNRTKIIDCLKKTGEDVLLKGWVVVVRSHGKIAFLDLRDGTGIIQVGAFSQELADKFKTLNTQDVIEIKGKVKKREERYINNNIPTGQIEIEASEISVLSKAEEMPFDMAGKELILELPTLLDFRSLTLRHPTISPIFKVQQSLVKEFRNAAEELGCIEVFVPTIAKGATEGGAEVFPIDYFGHKAYLTQSPQLYKQMLVGVFERVYTIAHAYRSEPSVTTRHLTESTQLDVEMGFIDNFDDLLTALEFVGTTTISNAAKENENILKQLNIDMPLISQSIPRLKLSEAQEIIFKKSGRDVRNEKDLSPEDEKEICQWAKEEKQSDFVTITHFPLKKRAFYTSPDPENEELSLSYDLLFKGIEIASGSQRIENYNELISAMKKRGIDERQFGLYLQAFKYGMPKEGGFSFGLERITMKLLDLKNVREATLFPRDMERVDERLSAPDSK